MALQHCSIVAERKMIRAANPYVQSFTRRNSLVDRLNVRLDLLGLGIRLAAVIAEKKHKWSLDARLNDTAMGSTVQIATAKPNRVASLLICVS